MNMNDYLSKEPYKYVVVLGNGFDLDLGLKTKYSDFVDSKEWADMYNERVKKEPFPVLIQYLYGKRFTDNWFDIESALLEYVSPKADGSFVNNEKTDKDDYSLLCTTLLRFLRNQLKKAPDIYDRPGAKFLRALPKNDNCILYSFNYTPIGIINNMAIGHNHITECEALHGCLHNHCLSEYYKEDNQIILGFETNDITNIAPGYSFMIKSNSSIYKPSNIVFDLGNAKEVVIYGHSLNAIDFCYFKDYFKLLTQYNEKKRSLTIITKDNSSRITILDNLRRNNISVSDIYSHSNIEFIYTTNINNKDYDDSAKFDRLISSFPIY